jgi:hypothetical protein
MAGLDPAMVKFGVVSKMLFRDQRDDLLKIMLIQRAEIADLVAIDIEHQPRFAAGDQRHDDL